MSMRTITQAQLQKEAKLETNFIIQFFTVVLLSFVLVYTVTSQPAPNLSGELASGITETT